MINQRDYTARLQRCLDERREPLDDPEVIAFLDAHPECLEDFARLRQDLRAVAAMPRDLTTPMRRPHTRWRYAAQTAAALLLIALGWTLRSLTSGDTTAGNTGSGLIAGNGLASNDYRDLHVPTHPPRILSASLQELEPTLRPAAFYTVRDPMVQTATLTLEAYEDRSELR